MIKILSIRMFFEKTTFVGISANTKLNAKRW